MSAALSRDDLSDADGAAGLARNRWLNYANDPRRGGKQIPPVGDWDQIIWKAGRGFGKTSALIQWQWWENWHFPNLIGHAVAPTLNDCRGTLFLGPAGFRAVIPAECLRGGSWEQACDISHLELHLANGSMIRGFGATDAGGRLRGPQAHNGIGDELREWDKPAGNLKHVHSNMMLGIRLPYPDGSPARACFATTPKPIAFLKQLYARPSVRVVTGTTFENMHNLSGSFLNTVLSYEGTAIGRAEIYGQDTPDEEIGIFKRSWFRKWPAEKPMPEFVFVLMTMDTAFEEEAWDSKKQEPDFSACGVFGVFNTKQVFTEQERRKMGIRHTYSALLADFWMERLGFPDLLTKARQSYRVKYGKPGRFPNVVLIENKASGISLRQTLQSFNVPVWPFNPGNQSKLMRAHTSSPYLLQGSLFVPESLDPNRKGQFRDWAEPLVEQCCAYAGKGSTEFDDGLDVLTSTTLYLASTGMIEATPDVGPFPDPDEKEEREQREAMRLADEEKRGKFSPYGV